MQYTDKIYGKVELPSVIEELIHTKVFQRLKRIHQGGVIILTNPTLNHTRFDHSIGVMVLIQKLGGTIEEQTAGLLHDISHTAFSHLVDYVFDNEEEDYHEKRYETVLKNKELMMVLKKHGFSINQFFDLEQFKLLEYPLPYLSADRIDYTLRDLLQLQQISKENINWFLDGLLVHEGRVVLKSKEYGEWFQTQYDYLVNEYFKGKENVEINVIMKKIIQDCLAKEIIKESDFYQDDFYLLEKIRDSIDLDARILEIKNQGLNINYVKTKSRSIDPEIILDNQVITLSAMKE